MKLFSYTLLVSLLCVGLSFNLEDLMSKAVFPPNVPDIPREPKGHNKPLGWQRPPAAAIKEYTEPLTAIDYWRLHVEPHIPLVLRGYLKESPAIKNWNDEYLAEHYGNLDILVEHKLEDRTSTSGRMRLKDFLKNYKEQDLYVVSMFPSEMMHEVRAIPSILCGTFKNFTHESNLWISNGGTRSVVHYDADHNLHCMIDGRKDFILINNNLTTKTNLYFKRKPPGVGSGFSFLDPDTIDMNKFKNIAKVPWTWATLYPGDCIFIPSVYIHQVRGYGRTIAVTTLFTADVKKNFKDDDCTDEIMKGYHSMADINFQWTYKKGDQTIDMGYMNVELVKHIVRQALSDPEFTRNKQFTMKQFILYAGMFTADGRNKTKMEGIWKNVFGLKEDSIFKEDMIDTFDLEQWKAYCRAVEAPHGVATNGTEPVFVRPGERHQWEKEHLKEDASKYLTEKEIHIREQADRDPMFDYLSPEEKEEYIRKKKEQKAKFGLNYNPEDEDIDIGGEIPWRLDDVPKRFRSIVAKGKIPKDFKEEFMNGLPDTVKERFAKELEQNIIPSAIRAVLEPDFNGESYDKKISKQMLEDEDDFGAEDDDDSDANPDRLQFTFNDIDKKIQKVIIQGKLPKGDTESLLDSLPEKYRKKYTSDIKKGNLPKEILMALLGATDETFDETVAFIKKKLKITKDEL